MKKEVENIYGNEFIDPVFSKKIYTVFLLFTSLWMILIFAPPALYLTGDTGEKISSFVYLFFSKVCHQDDQRSFHLLGHKLGVCSRCVWIYAGFFAGMVIYPFIKKINDVKFPSIWFLLIPVTLLGMDVLLDTFDILPNTFLSRSVTGFFIGLVLVFFLLPGFIKFFYEVNIFLKNKLSEKT